MALRMWASSTANALRISCASKAHLSPAFSLSRCFSTGIPSLYSNGFSLHLYIYMCMWTNFFTKKKKRPIWSFTFFLWYDIVMLKNFAVLDGLKYATSHEWVKHEGSVATIGITDHAQVSITSYLPVDKIFIFLFCSFKYMPFTSLWEIFTVKFS